MEFRITVSREKMIQSGRCKYPENRATGGGRKKNIRNAGQKKEEEKKTNSNNE